MRLPTLFICRGFPCDYIDTGVALSPELCHSVGKGWLLRVLIAVGFSWFTGCLLLMNFVMKCAIWMLVVYRASLNDVRSISSQSAMLVMFILSQCWNNRHLDIFYTID